VKDVEGLMDLLHDVKVVDPACGSGAFLVGMMQVFSELYRKLGKEPDYEFRERIVHENLHGVDIKDWAVRVAEFRMWLALVESEDEVPDVEPVLPNFDFKLKIGDSIVQKVADEYVSLDQIMRGAEGKIIEEIENLRGLKKRYFEGESELKKEIEEKQKGLIENHLEKTIKKLENAKDKNQVTLSGEMTEEAKEKKEKTVKEIQIIEETKDKLNEADEKGMFIWDLDFSEVMLEGGFDIVLGNPPYVSNENIIDQGIDKEVLDEMDSSSVDLLKTEYINALSDYVEQEFGFEPDGQSDLYMYFFYKGLELLKPNGNLTLITSDKWLDRGYGSDLQKVILTQSNIKRIIYNRRKRSFSDVGITTAITSLNKSESYAQSLKNDVHFISCSEEYTSLVSPGKLKSILFPNLDSTFTYRDEDIRYSDFGFSRVMSLSQAGLWKLGGGRINQSNHVNKKNIDLFIGTYDGEKWGAMFIRSPTTIFELLQKQSKLFGTLKDYGVSSYLNTGGVNKFYFVQYVSDEGEGLARIKNQEYGDEFIVEKEFLKPLIKSPRELEKLEIESDGDIDLRILVVPPNTNISEFHVGEYIRFGEEKGYNERSGPSRREPWWQPPNKAESGAEIVLPRTHNDNHRIFYNPNNIITDRFYRVNTKDGKIIACVLNSTFGNLFIEIYGDPRGEGALDLYTDDYEKLPVINTENIDTNRIPDNIEMFSRNIDSIFRELGADDQNDVDLESVKNDRRKLDKFVMEDILDLTKKQQIDIYQGILRLVNDRMARAHSA